MIQAILYDVVGTLTNINPTEFLRNYLGLLAPRFAHLMTPDKFAKQIMRSIETMQNEPRLGQTNMQTFFEDFCRVTGQSFQMLWPLFEEFYASDFPALRCLVQVNPQGVKVVEYAIQQGFQTAVASNPVMPMSAMKESIRWAGMSPEQFKIIPAFDTFHFSKPHLGFFKEVAESVGVKPEGCLLVSGHEEDIICRELGMKMFFVGSIGTGQTDYAGQLNDLLRLLGQGNL